MKMFLTFILFLIAVRCFSAWPSYWPLTTNGVVTNDLRQLFEDQIAAVNERCLATWYDNPVATNFVVVTNGATVTTNAVVITNDLYRVSPFYVSYTVPWATGLTIQSYSTNSFVEYTNGVGYTNVYVFTNWIVAETNLSCSNWTCRLGTNVVATNMVYSAAFTPQIADKIEALLEWYVQTNCAADPEAWYAPRLAASTMSVNGVTFPVYETISNLFVQNGNSVGQHWSATNGQASSKWFGYPQRLMGEQILGEFQIYSTNEYTTNGHVYQQLTARWADASTVDLFNASVSAWSNNGPANIKYRIVNPNTNGNQSIAGATFSVTGSVYHWVRVPSNAPMTYTTNGQFQYLGGDSGTAYNVNFYDITGGGSSFHLTEADNAPTPCNGASIQILWTPPYNVYGDVERRPTAEAMNARYKAINALRYTYIGGFDIGTNYASGSGEEVNWTNDLDGAKSSAVSVYYVTNTFGGLGGGANIRSYYEISDSQTYYRTTLRHNQAEIIASQRVSPYNTASVVRFYVIANTNDSPSASLIDSEFDSLGDGVILGLNLLESISYAGTNRFKGTVTHGNTTIPSSWPTTPAAPTNGDDVISARGWQEDGTYGIADWQFNYRDW